MTCTGTARSPAWILAFSFKNAAMCWVYNWAPVNAATISDCVVYSYRCAVCKSEAAMSIPPASSLHMLAMPRTTGFPPTTFCARVVNRRRDTSWMVTCLRDAVLITPYLSQYWPAF